MKTDRSETLYQALATQYRMWWGVNDRQSVALVDATICAVLGCFPYVVNMPIAWKYLAVPFLIGAVVRASHVWRDRS